MSRRAATDEPLSLSGARGNVRALDGEVEWVEDNPGGGASFRVLLPVSR